MTVGVIKPAARRPRVPAAARRGAERLLKYWRTNFVVGIGNAYHVQQDHRAFEDWLYAQLKKG